MSQIRMTPDTMRTRAGQTDKQAEAVQSVMTAMDNLLKTLKTEWEGEAVKGYEDRYNKIKPVLKNTIELLDEISKNLESLVGTTEDEAPKAEPKHPTTDTTTAKFANLQFGRNYDPTHK